jgi:hypothetical protein
MDKLTEATLAQLKAYETSRDNFLKAAEALAAELKSPSGSALAKYEAANQLLRPMEKAYHQLFMHARKSDDGVVTKGKQATLSKAEGEKQADRRADRRAERAAERTEAASDEPGDPEAT